MENKKSIAIIGEGETEWFYFDSLRIALRYPFKIAPAMPQHSDISHIMKLNLSLHPIKLNVQRAGERPIERNRAILAGAVQEETMIKRI